MCSGSLTFLVFPTQISTTYFVPLLNCKMNFDCETYQRVTQTKTFKYILYIALLSTTMVFVTNMIQEYQQGDSFFKSSKENITKKDVPVFTICFKSRNKLTYGMDFTVQALTVASPNNSTFKTLSQGITTYDYCSYNPETHTCDHEKHTMVLKQLTLANLTLVNRSCISMYLTMANVDNWIICKYI